MRTSWRSGSWFCGRLDIYSMRERGQSLSVPVLTKVLYPAPLCLNLVSPGKLSSGFTFSYNSAFLLIKVIAICIFCIFSMDMFCLN